MKDFEIVDLLPLLRQMTLVIFYDSDIRKCEVQILPVSLKMTELRNIQAMLKIPSQPGDDAATVSVEIDEILKPRDYGLVWGQGHFTGTAGAGVCLFLRRAGKRRHCKVLGA